MNLKAILQFFLKREMVIIIIVWPMDIYQKKKYINSLRMFRKFCVYESYPHYYLHKNTEI